MGGAGWQGLTLCGQGINKHPWVTARGFLLQANSARELMARVHGYGTETHPISRHGPAQRSDRRHRRRHHHGSTRSQQQGRSTRECSGALSRLPAGNGESRARRANGLSNRPPNHNPPSGARGSWINQEHPNALRS